MRLQNAILALLVTGPLANAACPDVSGNFEGLCQEPGGRSAFYQIEIAQTGCESVKVKVPLFSDDIQITEDFGGRKYGEGSAYSETRAAYTKTSLITEIRTVSKRGKEFLETSKFKKFSVNGIDHLEFTQRLTGAVTSYVSCTIQAK